MAHDHRMNPVGEPHLNRVQQLKQSNIPQAPLNWMDFMTGDVQKGGWRGVSDLRRVRSALAKSPTYAERGLDTSDEGIADNLERYRLQRDRSGPPGDRGYSVEYAGHMLKKSINEGRRK